MPEELQSLREENALLRRQLDRERRARQSAEALAEAGTSALYERQSELSLLASLAAAANGRDPAPATLRTILRLLAEFGGWQVAHIYRSSPDSPHLASTDLWHAQPPARFERFRAATRDTSFNHGEGFPGRIWASGEPLLLPDLAAAPFFVRQASAAECGLVCGFGFPIKTSGGDTAVIELFSIRRHEPGEQLAQLVPQLTAQIGRIFEREAAEEAQRRARAELEDTVQRRTRELAASFDELERRLQEQRRLQRSLLIQDRALAASSEAIIIIDVQDATRPIVYCNPAFETVTGYAPSAVIGRNADFLVGPRTDPAAVTRIRDAFAKAEPLTIVLETHRRDGSAFWSEVALSPIRDDTGTPTHFIAIQKDVTERQLLAERTRAALAASEQANAELARVARLKDDFLAAMSHELRTPLNAVLGTTMILQEQIFGTLGEKQRELVGNIDESSRHLLDLINDILDLSKIEADKVELREEPVELTGLARSSVLFIRQAAQKKELKVVLDLAPDLPLVRADGRRLKQILVNLLSNAVKFTPEGGTVGLDVRLDRDTRRLRLVVWDTGIGIAREDHHRLFHPFVQIDSRLARRYEGTGLGLALVRRLAELHGGTVELESEMGQGSRFIVSLPWHEVAAPPTPEPIEPAPPAPAPAPTPVAPPALGLRILIAEDNPRNFQMLRSYLHAHGCSILHAADGAVAVAMSEVEQPDVILMDVQMPKMDGLEAMRRIRANPATASLPIIALTALAMPSDERDCLEAGANRYMSKPIRLAGLRELILELAPQPRPRPSAPLG